MRLTRADKSVLSDWWFTVDRLMFFGLLLLMGAGLVLSLAASPPIAERYDLEAFYFVRRHAALLLPAIVIMFAVSNVDAQADQTHEPRHLPSRHRVDDRDSVLRR